jgi:hypothetical protein
MGGMAAQIPIAGDDAANERALARVRADKVREVGAGHDGTWVAHPALIPLAREVFDTWHAGAHQQRDAQRRARKSDANCATRCSSPRSAPSRAPASRQRRSLRALPRRVARRQRLRADPLADGRRRHRRDQPRAAVAVAARTARPAPRRRHADRFRAVRTRPHRPAQQVRRPHAACPAPRASPRRSRCSNASPTPTRSKTSSPFRPTHFVNALGALTGNQAMQQVKAGLKAIYLSGWQVAADANLAGEMYPDQSLYPANSVPQVVKRINNTLLRADQIHHAEGNDDIDYFAPIVADAEAGFGGVLNAFELMKAMIEAGAAGVHFEDQLASVKKCGHMGGKVLVPTREAVQKLVAARLAADVMGVPTLCRAHRRRSRRPVTSDVDDNDKPFSPASAPSKASTRRARARPGDRAASPTRRTPTWCGARPASRTSPSPRPSPRRSTRSSPASCSPTTARRRSTGRRTSTTRPSPSSSASWARWATSSSSSRWPASTALNYSMFDLATATRATT